MQLLTFCMLGFDMFKMAGLARGHVGRRGNMKGHPLSILEEEQGYLVMNDGTKRRTPYLMLGDGQNTPKGMFGCECECVWPLGGNELQRAWPLGGNKLQPYI